MNTSGRRSESTGSERGSLAFTLCSTQDEAPVAETSSVRKMAVPPSRGVTVAERYTWCSTAASR